MIEWLVAGASLAVFFSIPALLWCLERRERYEDQVWMRRHLSRLNRYARQMRPGGKYYVPPRRKKRQLGSCS